jgi:hypothetical protein
VRPCLHLAADGTGRNATRLRTRNAFSADPWRKEKGRGYKGNTSIESIGSRAERNGELERVAEGSGGKELQSNGAG